MLVLAISDQRSHIKNMVFGEQTLNGFLEARDAATDLLREQDSRHRLRTLSLEEAMVLQVASYVYGERPDFFGRDISRHTAGVLGSNAYTETEKTYGILNTFVERDGLFERIHMSRQRSGEHFKLYTPTILGKKALELFVPESASVAVS